MLKRFRAEAITLAKLNHPNIATLYELGQHGDELLMVMEFVRGETFDKLSERVGPMPFERAAYLIAQVLDALGHAHRVGIVHRDMKPANLILSESGVVKVMDFGIARMVGTEHLTNDGYMMGTPAYMAPEQVMGNEVDGRADLYGVGVILFRMLTGHLPFKADTAAAMVQKQIKDAPTPLRQFRAELPVWCEQILDRALAKPPEARYQTADEFRSALMLSAALAPATEVTSVLAAGGVTPDPEMTIAPRSDADPAGTVRLRRARAVAAASGRGPPHRLAAQHRCSSRSLGPPSAAISRGEPARVGRPARPAGRQRAPMKSYARPGGRPSRSVVVVAALFVTLRRPSQSDTPASTPAAAPAAPAAAAPEAAPPAAAGRARDSRLLPGARRRGHRDARAARIAAAVGRDPGVSTHRCGAWPSAERESSPPPDTPRPVPESRPDPPVDDVCAGPARRPGRDQDERTGDLAATHRRRARAAGEETGAARSSRCRIPR